MGVEDLPWEYYEEDYALGLEAEAERKAEMAGKKAAKGKSGGGGQRPALRLVAVTKDKDGRQYHDIGAAWPSEHVPGAFNFKLEDGVRLKHPDGGFITTGKEGDHYLNLEPPRKPRDEEPEDEASDDETEAGDDLF